MKSKEYLNILSSEVIGAAIEVHKALGPGLLEKSYEECLYYELRERGVGLEKQLALPLQYKKVHLDVGYKVDLMVEDELIIEIKSVLELNDVHLAQLLTYLKLSDCNLGLLINFNVPILKNGIKRVVNNF